MPLAPPVAALLDQFQAAKPLRAWSLIITLYGDAIVPRGGSLWLGSLVEIMALFGIDAGHVRTAMSRLTADGWLERRRLGRNSYYRLSAKGEGIFGAASERIYGGGGNDSDGHLRLALLSADVPDRAAIRSSLEAIGFVALSPTSYVAVGDSEPRLLDRAGVYFLKVKPSDEAKRIAATAWKLGALADAYRTFIAQFAALENSASRLAEAEAFVVRILLIHEFRRIVLRDPGLPAPLSPLDWPEPMARALAGGIYRTIMPRSEVWLTHHARNEKGPLSPLQAGVKSRFKSIK